MKFQKYMKNNKLPRNRAEEEYVIEIQLTRRDLLSNMKKSFKYPAESSWRALDKMEFIVNCAILKVLFCALECRFVAWVSGVYGNQIAVCGRQTLSTSAMYFFCCKSPKKRAIASECQANCEEINQVASFGCRIVFALIKLEILCWWQFHVSLNPFMPEFLSLFFLPQKTHALVSPGNSVIYTYFAEFPLYFFLPVNSMNAVQSVWKNRREQ